MTEKHYKELCRACDYDLQEGATKVWRLEPELHELRKQADDILKNIKAFEKHPKKTKGMQYVIDMLKRKFKNLPETYIKPIRKKVKHRYKL